MCKIEIDFKLWNLLNQIELETNLVKFGITEIHLLQHIYQFCSGLCIH